MDSNRKTKSNSHRLIEKTNQNRIDTRARYGDFMLECVTAEDEVEVMRDLGIPLQREDVEQFW
jgi:hypothetical protein